MVVCPDCGKDVKDAKFCSNCGALLPKMDEVAVEEVRETTEDVEREALQESEITDIEIKSADEAAIIDVNVKDEPDEETVVEEPEEPKKSKFCSNCGLEVNLNTTFCPQCGFKLTPDEAPQTKFCQSCGKKININAEICPHCGVRVAGVVPSGEKSVALAAILSFLFPGLGHLYNGLTKKGVYFIIAYIVSAVLILLLIGFILVIIVWIWALIDAIKTTEAINRGEHVEDKLF